MKKNLIELLPWYENGTLDPDEMSAVDRLLADFEKARQELEKWKVIDGSLIDQKLKPTKSQVMVIDLFESQTGEHSVVCKFAHSPEAADEFGVAACLCSRVVAGDSSGGGFGVEGERPDPRGVQNLPRLNKKRGL